MVDYPFWAQIYQSGEIIEARDMTAAVEFALTILDCQHFSVWWYRKGGLGITRGYEKNTNVLHANGKKKTTLKMKTKKVAAEMASSGMLEE